MAEPKWLQDLKEEDYIKEDFDATGKSRYTVEGVDKNDPDWLNKAAKKVHGQTNIQKDKRGKEKEAS